MIADSNRHMPDALRIDADQRFFEASLDAASVVAHGRYSHERQAHSEGRRRLILTRRVTAIAPDPSNPLALFWNPAGKSFTQTCLSLGVIKGVVAVIGGTEVFGEFLQIGYDAFYLSRAGRVRLPGGRPLFSPRYVGTPEEVLSQHGLVPSSVRILNSAAELTLATWSRQLDSN